jgi:hypothetical protein
VLEAEGEVIGIAELLTTGFGGGEGCSGALSDPLALLFGYGGMNMQHERIDVGAQLGDDERDALHH